jgi:hypothetical protein
MAAGLGFKTFTTGEVLTAADTNGYLMQGVLVFASAAARDAAITSPQEGQFAYTKDTNGLWYYDGAAWVASGAAGDIEGVTAGVGISGGGTSGTVTVTNSMATAITTNGDLIYGTGSGTFTRRAIGATNDVLTVAGGIPTWAAASAFSPTFTTYSPVFTQGGTFTATNQGKYLKIGQLCYVEFEITAPSFTGTSNNRWNITLPFTSADVFTGYGNVGVVNFYDTSAANYSQGFLNVFGTSTYAEFQSGIAKATQRWGSTGSEVAIQFATGDTISGSFTYKVA